MHILLNVLGFTVLLWQQNSEPHVVKPFLSSQRTGKLVGSHKCGTQQSKPNISSEQSTKGNKRKQPNHFKQGKEVKHAKRLRSITKFISSTKLWRLSHLAYGCVDMYFHLFKIIKGLLFHRCYIYLINPIHMKGSVNLLPLLPFSTSSSIISSFSNGWFSLAHKHRHKHKHNISISKWEHPRHKHKQKNEPTYLSYALFSLAHKDKHKNKKNKHVRFSCAFAHAQVRTA